MKKLILLILNVFLFAKIVTVTGTGVTPVQAKQDALRSAVEEVVGADIKSNSMVKNGKMVLDKIASNTSGYIKNYKEVDKYKEGPYWHVTLRVEVDENALKNDVKSILKSRRAMRDFQSSNFKNRSVLVIYQKKGMDALPKNYIAVDDLLNTIEDKLRDKEFDVILPDDLPGMAKKDEFSDDEILLLGSKAKADAIVVATINAGKRKTGDGYAVIFARVSLKAYDPTSRRLFATVIKRGKVIASDSQFGLNDGAARAASKVANIATEELVEKIVTRLNKGARQWIVVTFKNADEDVQDSILDVFDDMGYPYKVVFQEGNYIKLKVSSDLSGTELRRIIKKALKTENIRLKTLKTQGDNIIFKVK